MAGLRLDERLMRAVVYERFGGPEVLELQTLPTPEPGAGQLLVAVHAAGVNPVDAQNRADGAWAAIQPPVTPGYDFSGVVETAGEGAEGWTAGEAVFGALPVRVTRHGTYAEYVVIDADLVARKPERLSHVEAAAVPLAASTAHEAIRRLRLEPGERVLIWGAGGGVGTFAVQIARNAGARVFAVASARHHSLLAGLGAEACIDYTSEDVDEAVLERAGGEVDAVADFVGAETLARSLGLLREGGRAVEIAGLAGDIELLIDKNQELHGVLFNPANPAPFAAVAELVEAGDLGPVIDDVLALEDAAEAHRRLEAGHRQGKLVLEARG
jgi:NADPH2:quinone reductase